MSYLANLLPVNWSEQDRSMYIAGGKRGGKKVTTWRKIGIDERNNDALCSARHRTPPSKPNRASPFPSPSSRPHKGPSLFLLGGERAAEERRRRLNREMRMIVSGGAVVVVVVVRTGHGAKRRHGEEGGSLERSLV